MLSKQGNFFVVSASSGTGKTSLVRALAKTIHNLKISISYTTRLPRPGDKNGEDYYFVTQQQFAEMVDDQAFLEYANVYGFNYGTSRDWVIQQLAQGMDVILEIDWQGAQLIQRQFSAAILIFLIPPSLATLKERLEKRQQDQEQVIATRLAGAKEEMSHYAEFDYLIVNDDFSQALNDLVHIVCAERLRCKRQAVNQAELLVELLKQ